MPGGFTRHTQIEDLMRAYPGAVGVMVEQGLPCVVCGEPFWGTIEELAYQKGWNDIRIQQLVDQLNSRH